jgi:very-short-patch-repair endonuclease
MRHRYRENPDGRKPFVHGSEEDIGDFRPIKLVEAVESVIDRIRSMMEIGGNCDSPIEVQMGAAILTFFERAGHPLRLCKMLDLKNLPNELVLVPQFAWSYYRSDWAILNPTLQGALLIECDGKDFHSSAEQRKHDWQKDANAHDRGYLTMRFTGSQIFRDADGCAQKIYDSVFG